jgi:hypothetical protein
LALANKTHVITATDDPLDALIQGTHYKAYLVANLTFNDGPEASAEHYGLSLADVHTAMVFHYDNEAKIKESLAAMDELGKKHGAKKASEHLAEIRARQKK